MDTARNASVPLYRRVYEIVVQRIVSGELRPGAMLPSETDLGAELGVSQGTARKALIELEQSGVIERRQGRGTFVATTTPESALFHFFRLRRTDGTQAIPEPVEETVRKRRGTAKEVVALGCDKGSSVFEIARVRSIDGRLVSRETSILQARLFPGIGDRGPLPNALYTLYQQAYGFAVVRAEEKLRAVPASEAIASALEIAEGTPLMEVERRALDITGRVIEFRLSLYVTDDLSYNVTLK